MTREDLGPGRGIRVAAGAALLLYVASVLVVLLNPSAWIGSAVTVKVWEAAVWLGAPPTWENLVRAEFFANVVLLAPLTFLGSIVWARVTWRDWTAYAFVVSAAAETVQALVLAQRTATFSDVVANTLGGLIGAVIGTITVRALMVWQRRTTPRDGTRSS